jgi:hypothetical protein
MIGSVIMKSAAFRWIWSRKNGSQGSVSLAVDSECNISGLIGQTINWCRDRHGAGAVPAGCKLV